MFWELVERKGLPTFTSKALSIPSSAVRILNNNNNNNNMSIIIESLLTLDRNP